MTKYEMKLSQDFQVGCFLKLVSSWQDTYMETYLITTLKNAHS